MAMPFQPAFSASSLINQTRFAFERFPDTRKTGNNLKYAVADAAMSAFGVFFTQSPSFLDYQTRMEKKYGKSNAQSIFGIHQLPSMNQVRNLLDPVPPDTLYPLFQDINDSLYHQGYFDTYRSIDGTLLMPMDGIHFFSSEKISCPCCSQKTLKNGKTVYNHTAVTPVIVAPGKSDVIPLPPELVLSLSKYLFNPKMGKKNKIVS